MKQQELKFLSEKSWNILKLLFIFHCLNAKDLAHAKKFLSNVCYKDFNFVTVFSQKSKYRKPAALIWEHFENFAKQNILFWGKTQTWLANIAHRMSVSC